MSKSHEPGTWMTFCLSISLVLTGTRGPSPERMAVADEPLPASVDHTSATLEARPTGSQADTAENPKGVLSGSTAAAPDTPPWDMQQWIEGVSSSDGQRRRAAIKKHGYGSVEFDADGEVVRVAVCGSRWNDRKLADFARLPKLKTMLVAQGSAVTDRGLVHLQQAGALEILKLSSREAFTDAGLKHLGAIRNLRELRLFRHRCTDAGLEHLVRLQNLDSLRLSGGELTGAGYKHLGRLRNLVVLDCPGTPGDDAIRQLADLDKLASLDLRADRLGKAGYAALAELDALRVLYLRGGQITSECVDELARLTELDKLLIPGAQISDEDLARLKNALPNCEVQFRR